MIRVCRFLLWLLPLALSSAALRADIVDLSSVGRLEIVVEPGWKVVSEDLGADWIIEIRPKAGIHALGSIRVVWMNEDAYNTRAKLRAKLMSMSQPVLRESIEKRFTTQDLAVQQGFGLYADFTNPVPQTNPPAKDSFSVKTMGLIRVNERIILAFQIVSNGLLDPSHIAMLAAIEHATLLPPAEAKAAARK